MALNLNLDKPLLVVSVILGAMVSLLLIAALLPAFFSSTASITENVTSGDVGNVQANTILHAFGFIVPVVIILGIVGLIFAAVKFSKN